MKASSVEAESIPGAATAGTAATGVAMIAADVAAAAASARNVGQGFRPVLRYAEARGFLARARGLLWRPELPPGCGLMLRGVRSVHGFGMRYAIDLVFLDEPGAVVGCRRLAPFGVARCAAAKDVLEMRGGEIKRLGLRLGMRPILQPALDIFEPSRPDRAGPTAIGRDHQDRKGPTPRSPTWPLLVLAAACVLGASAHPSLAQAAPAAGPAGAALERLEREAEALYHASAPDAATVELVRLYEALAAVAPHRSSHAWLRIGNIHQRAGSIGAAIDAYRRAAQAGGGAHLAGTSDDSQRKARLNVAALGLELVRQSLADLGLVPSAAVYREQLNALEGLVREAARPPGRTTANPAVNQAASIPAAPDRLSADDGSAQLRSPPVVERYTASGRRNSLKTARGSLHVDPADGLPAKPLPKPRSRPLQEQLPTVEYLLGDPQRFKQPAQGTADQTRRATSRPGKEPSQKQAVDAAGGGG